MICRRCGLETGHYAQHAGPLACSEAVKGEVYRLFQVWPRLLSEAQVDLARGRAEPAFPDAPELAHLWDTLGLRDADPMP